MSHLVNLNKDSRCELKTIGTKAFNLQKLMLVGVRVPSCSVVTTDAFRESSKKQISESLLEELTENFPKWTCPIIARSSSLAEDTSQSSKAGVFTTVPNVNTLSDLQKAIEKVWSSSHGEDIAVILQEQLNPDIAGVLFTRDPVTGKNKKVIEYVEGMGDTLVSGMRNPVWVGEEDSRFKELIEEGERLEKFFGYPLDIEWAKIGKTFYILQTRPITALPVPTKEAGTTYSMVLAEQFFSGPVSPLFFSLFKFLFEEYYAGETAREVGLDVLPKEPLMIRHKDHMYVNTYPTEYLLKKGRGLGSFQQQLKVLPEDIRKEFEDSKSKNVLGALGLLSRIAFLLLRRPNLRKAKVDREFIRKTIPAVLTGLETILEEPKTKNDMEHQYKMLIELLVQHIRSSKWGLAYCIMLSSIVQRSLEKKHIEDSEVKLLTLMSGLPNEKTSKGIKELQILADKFKQDEHVNNILNRELKKYERFREELVRAPQGRQFAESFESILYRYGHRRLARDLIQPSWCDDPMILFNMLRNMILYQDQRDLWTKIENSKLEREKVLNEILKEMPIHKRRRFKTNSQYLIRYLSFRELQRFYLDMILSRMRSLILEVGESMVRDGLLEEEHDIFFLEIDEIKNYLKGDKTNLRYIAAFRKMSFKESDQKPGLYMRHGVDFDVISSSDVKYSNGMVIKGQPVSSGTFKGKVKVIDNIDSSCSILPGTVLVTKNIDPGQTQVFTSAGGLILEVGGVLSHGAILAREFGIPTVAQVNGATNLFYDGQEVVVNGTKGEVVLVEKK
jgi:pyruvate,water dikinase